MFLVRIRGFTLVELVMVLVLIGVLSAAATSLFSSRGAFSVFVAKDQLISSALMAQQMALANQVSATPSSLTVSLDSTTSEWVFQVSKSGEGVVSESRSETAGAVLSILRSDSASVSLPATLSWDRSANMTPRFGYQFTFTGQNSVKVCLSSAGFAYELSSGSCP